MLVDVLRDSLIFWHGATVRALTRNRAVPGLIPRPRYSFIGRLLNFKDRANRKLNSRKIKFTSEGKVQELGFELPPSPRWACYITTRVRLSCAKICEHRRKSMNIYENQ